MACIITVGCLLFADDVALLAASHGELQLMVDVYAEYARRWRFCPNVGKSKTVCFAPAVPPRVPLRLLGEDMEEVDAFKYLGVEFQKDGKWEAVHARLLASAKRAAGYLNALGLGHFHMSPKGGEALWKSLIRPVQDWAADVVPISHRAAQAQEVFQRTIAKKVMGAPARTPNAVALGEMGWRPRSFRRDDLRLRMFRRVALMQTSRAVRRIALVCKERFDERRRRGEGPRPRSSTWVGEIHQALLRFGLEKYWSSATWARPEFVAHEQWAATIEAAACPLAEEEWKRDMQSKVSLALYRSIKTSLQREPFLDGPVADNRAVAVRVGLRGGVHALEVSAARLDGAARAPREERLCRVCNSGEVEDVAHFLLDCPALVAPRSAMMSRMEKLDHPAILAWGDWMHVMLGASVRVDGTPLKVSRELDTVAMREVLKMARARHRVLYPLRPGGAGSSDSD